MLVYQRVPPTIADMPFMEAIMEAKRINGHFSSMEIHWLVVSNIFYFPFHIWDVIPTPLTNSIIFQWGRSTTNQFNITRLRHAPKKPWWLVTWWGHLKRGLSHDMHTLWWVLYPNFIGSITIV